MKITKKEAYQIALKNHEDYEKKWDEYLKKELQDLE